LLDATLAEIKSIKESQKYQLILIIVSLVLIVLAFYGNTYLESIQKDKIIDQQQDKISQQKAIVLRLNQDNHKLQDKIKELQATDDKTRGQNSAETRKN
jgi:hypothetical protein